MRWAIAGLGYTARALADQLRRRGDEMYGCSRTAEVASWRQRGVVAEVAAAESWSMPPCDVAVGLFPPSGEAPDAEGSWVRKALAAGAHHIVYVSSTGVYGPASGQWVDESGPLAPQSRAGRARVVAEAAVAAAVAGGRVPIEVRCTLLRPAGIYGPGRAPWERVARGEYRLVDGGRAASSRIHVEDLAAAIVAVVAASADGVFNVADDDPASMADVHRIVAAREVVPAPTHLSAADASPELAAMLLADRRISAAALRAATGWVPRYPSWQDAWREARDHRAAT